MTYYSTPCRGSRPSVDVTLDAQPQKLVVVVRSSTLKVLSAQLGASKPKPNAEGAERDPDAAGGIESNNGDVSDLDVEGRPGPEAGGGPELDAKGKPELDAGAEAHTKSTTVECLSA